MRDTLRTYRQVAARWPTRRRRLVVNWTIHHHLAYVEDRFDLRAAIVEAVDDIDLSGLFAAEGEA